MNVIKKLELYIHIPFCVKKCAYCDFLSGPAERTAIEEYMQALHVQLKAESISFSKYKVVSIFIGGGTPSLVEPKLIADLLHEIALYYYVEKDAEISIELNPGTISKDSLLIYRQAGINRLSIGLQSSVAKELELLGRIHDFDQFLFTYQMAREVGFDNINVDIMYALPEQSMKSYISTIEQLMQLSPQPEHISAYSLIVEEGTPFFQLFQEEKLILPNEDLERDMSDMTIKLLEEQGYCQYEISNFCKIKKECVHNIGYWKREEYLGLGLGSASLINESRYLNESNIGEYLKAPHKARKMVQKLSIEEQMEEYMFLGLRMMEGISCQKFEEIFHCDIYSIYGNIIQENIKHNLLKEVEKENPNGEKEIFLTLTTQGVDLSNYVMAQFLLSE